MKLEAFGISTCRRIVRDDGSVFALVEKMTNGKWMIFVGEARLTDQQFDTPKKALNWVGENVKMTTPIAPSITDEQLAELEVRVEQTKETRHSTLMSHEWLSALVARLRAAEKDSARYRWLRDRVGVDFVYGDFMTFLPAGGYRLDDKTKAQTDEAIDTAMEQSK